MGIDLTGLVRPQVVEMTRLEGNPDIAEFVLQPLERGFGHTLGNALRRMLLSSLRGSAVWGFRLDGVVHEHQTVQGVLEDVHQIVQRLKSLTLVLAEDVNEATLTIRKRGPGAVTAGDIQDTGRATIVNPSQLLFTIQDDREVNCELHVNKGRGYVESELHPADRSMLADLVRIDAIYNPVRRANFTVSETRVGQRTDYDRLAVSVETDGTISPEDAIAYAAALAQEHFRYFVEFGIVPEFVEPEPEVEQQMVPAEEMVSASVLELLNAEIERLGIAQRSVNSLKNSKVTTVRDLVEITTNEANEVKNVGVKAMEEITEALQKHGLAFGMKFEEVGNGLRILDKGKLPEFPVAAAAAAPEEEEK